MKATATRIGDGSLPNTMRVQFANQETGEDYGVLQVRVLCGVSLSFLFVAGDLYSVLVV